MQEQYEKIKSQYKDTIVLFRLGDFFEAFNEDAEILSKVLGITLTGRGKDESRTPMAGIPHHALPSYMPKMVEAGLKVAIADQITDAVPGKLVERQVTKIITPGTIIDENSLDSSKNNYIASVYIKEDKKAKKLFNIAFCDLTTGELKVFNTDNLHVFKNEISKFKPAEILCSQSQIDNIKNTLKERLEVLDDEKYSFEYGYKVLLEQFNVQSLKGFGISDDVEKNGIVETAAALIGYLRECQKGELKHIKSIKPYSYSDFMQLDFETIRNLELLFPMSGADYSSTLYAVLNQCENSMGKRKLRQWILTPLINQEMLEERLEAVDIFYNKRILTSNVKECLIQIADIERIVGRIGVGSANPKDLVALKNSLIKILELRSVLTSEDLPRRLKYLTDNISNEQLQKIIDIIETSIDDDPSSVLNQGGIVKDGYNSEVDELRNLRNNSKKILADIQRREIERTQINSLKIAFNNVFGYYIEVTKTHLDKVPNDYIRKQTLANAERFITEELKELESKILNAEERLIKLETELFIQIREKIAEYASMLLEVSDSIAEIDVLSNFGEISREFRYSKPLIKSRNTKDSCSLKIVNGRHPVVEKLVKEFTPNITDFNNGNCINIITGPNMSGKSTYIRQVALIVLMAQIGCFVPADSMEFEIVDRIFTRVGAGDNLAKGESTFMVEMTETANILNNATSKSLIILDEVGRGTSTYDGVAIAWSIVEYIHENLKSMTLFATHYHELTELEEKYSGIKNYNVKVIEEGGDILFTHRIVEGSANKSYGVYVAKIAGVPDEVVDRANEILKRFEQLDRKGSEDSVKKEKSLKKDTASGRRSPKLPKKIHPEQLGLI